MSKKLCQACRRLNVEKLSSAAGQVYVAEDSNLDACLLCRGIFFFSNLPRPEELKDKEVRLKLLKHVSAAGDPSMCLYINFGTSWEKTMAEPFTDKDDVAALRFGVPTFRNLTTSGSPETMVLAARWFKHCVTNHDCFKSISETGNVVNTSRISQVRSLAGPTRLLDLEAFGERSLDLQLVENTRPERVYATLSHCWGKTPNPLYQTTVSTKQKRLSRIWYDDMPASFRDAMSVCRELGIRYLWIDSLCIVQDSTDDWKREATSMSDVYSNSCLTISADWSHTPDGGCFNVRKASQGLRMDSDEVVCITNRLSDGSHGSLYFSHYYSPDHQSLDSTWLSTRAWVCQERLLSRRNLHFAQDQLFWECRSAFAGEDLVPRGSGQLIPAFLLDLSSEDTELRLHRWYLWIIPGYTERHLTVPTDKLLAISAVAKVFQKSLQTPYLAGLWLEGLWYGLSWYSNNWERREERSKAYIAPSWSWASANCGVQWLIQLPSGGVKKRVEIEDAATTYDLDEFGHVSEGWIRLNGWLMVSVPIPGKPSLYRSLDDALLDEDPSALYNALENALLYGKPSSATGSSFLDVAYLDIPENPQDPQLKSVDCLLLGEEESPNGVQYFLLLVATSKERNRFKRVGVGKRFANGLNKELVQCTITVI